MTVSNSSRVSTQYYPDSSWDERARFHIEQLGLSSLARCSTVMSINPPWHLKEGAMGVRQSLMVTDRVSKLMDSIVKPEDMVPDMHTM